MPAFSSVPFSDTMSLSLKPYREEETKREQHWFHEAVFVPATLRGWWGSGCCSLPRSTASLSQLPPGLQWAFSWLSSGEMLLHSQWGPCLLSRPAFPQEMWEKLPTMVSAAQGPGCPWVSALGWGPMAVPGILSPAPELGLVEWFWNTFRKLTEQDQHASKSSEPLYWQCSDLPGVMPCLLRSLTGMDHAFLCAEYPLLWTGIQ